jgi:hypothetical protein
LIKTSSCLGLNSSVRITKTRCIMLPALEWVPSVVLALKGSVLSSRPGRRRVFVTLRTYNMLRFVLCVNALFSRRVGHPLRWPSSALLASHVLKGEDRFANVLSLQAKF